MKITDKTIEAAFISVEDFRDGDVYRGNHNGTIYIANRLVFGDVTIYAFSADGDKVLTNNSSQTILLKGFTKLDAELIIHNVM